METSHSILDSIIARRHFIRIVNTYVFDQTYTHNIFDTLIIQNQEYTLMFLINEYYDRMTENIHVDIDKHQFRKIFHLKHNVSDRIFSTITKKKLFSNEEFADLVLTKLSISQLVELFTLLYAIGKRRQILRQKRRSSSLTRAAKTESPKAKAQKKKITPIEIEKTRFEKIKSFLCCC